MAVKNQRPSKVGLREIALAAQVSPATVSRVLNGNSRVDPSIQKRVMAAVASLKLNISQWNRTKILVLVLSNRAMLHTFHSRILVGAEAYCAANGWDIVFLPFNYSPAVSWKELPLPNILQRRDMVRGVILAGTNFPNLIELLNHKGIPLVMLGNNIIGDPRVLENNDVVFADDIQGGQDMTQYLINLGHRRIGFVGNLHLPWFKRCFKGYFRAMETSGLQIIHSSIDSEDDIEVGYLGAKSLLSKEEHVSAIFAGNDPTAYGVCKALRDCGLRIPVDVNVAGCDDTTGAWHHPRLTTVREFPEQLGKQMVAMVLKRISAPTLAPQSVTIATEIIKRESCGPYVDHEQSMADLENGGPESVARST